MTSIRRLHVPSILLLALVAALAFAATAAAETKVGEATSPVDSSIENGEADLLGASASYEPSTGEVSVSVTTRVAPGTTPPTEEEIEDEEVHPSVEYLGMLATSSIPCSTATFEAEEERLQKERDEGTESDPPTLFPGFALIGGNRPLEPETSLEAVWEAIQEGSEIGAQKPGKSGPASKSVAGSTVTMGTTSSLAANGAFNCVFVEAFALHGSSNRDVLLFPLTPKPAPPVVTPPATTAPAAAFSLTKIKPLKAKVGKWTKVKVKFTNSGDASSGPVVVRLKAPKGVVLQPRSGALKIPSLAAGQSWTLTFKAKLTKKAKKKSTVKVTTSSGTISAAGSFILKRAG
jgi:hypothetical protein